jgi:predicted DNA-binding transcriptional regulator AlpA
MPTKNQDKKDQAAGKDCLPQEIFTPITASSRLVTPTLLTEAQAASYIGMSRAFLKKARYTGIVDDDIPAPPYIIIGKRSVRYYKEDLEQWLQRFPKRVSTHLDPHS